MALRNPGSRHLRYAHAVPPPSLHPRAVLANGMHVIPTHSMHTVYSKVHRAIGSALLHSAVTAGRLIRHDWSQCGHDRQRVCGASQHEDCCWHVVDVVTLTLQYRVLMSVLCCRQATSL